MTREPESIEFYQTELANARDDRAALRAEIERLGSLATIVREQGCEILRLTEEVNALRLVATAHDPEIVRRDAEVERLRAAIAYVRMRSQHACEILNEFDNARAALEPKP